MRTQQLLLAKGAHVLAPADALEQVADDGAVEHGHEALRLGGDRSVEAHDAPEGEGDDDDGGGGEGRRDDDCEEGGEQRGEAGERLS